MVHQIKKFVSAVSAPFREDPVEKARKECAARGSRWRWNASTNTCEEINPIDLTPPKRTPEEAAQRTRTQEEINAGIIGETRTSGGELVNLPQQGAFKEGDIVTDTDTGVPTGIIKNGKFFALPREDIQNIVNKGLAERAPIEGAETATGRLERERIETETAELFATGTPERVELDPITTQLEKFPVFGPLNQLIKDKLVKLFGGESNAEITQEILMSTAISEIERIEIQKGLTASEKFGTVAEALNAGELAKFIPGLGGAEKPSGNVQTLLKGVRTLKSRAVDVETKFNRGIGTKTSHTMRLDDIEREIEETRFRIKVLIQGSPDLKFNSDGVNFIELKLLEVDERIFDSRLALIAGPSEDSSDFERLAAAQEAIAEEDFDIPGL